jgi:hypothetical protein
MEELIYRMRTSDYQTVNELYGSELLNKQVMQVILSASVILGLELPPSETALDILIEEISSFMKDFGYGNYAVAEILLAIRFNIQTLLKIPSSIQLFTVNLETKNLSIKFISDVLHNYSTLRNNLDRKFQNTIDGYDTK